VNVWSASRSIYAVRLARARCPGAEAGAWPASLGREGPWSSALGRDERCTPRSGGTLRAAPPRGVQTGVWRRERAAGQGPLDPARIPPTYIGRYRPLYHAAYCSRALEGVYILRMYAARGMT
jgi:hypothetical protein